MPNQYDADGIGFSYPADWQTREERREQSTSIELSGPATATCSVMLLHDRPEPELAVEAVVNAFLEEYEEVDRYDVHDAVARRPTVGCDLDFFCLELCNSAGVRAFRTHSFTALLMFQANSDDLDCAREAFETICASFDYDAEQM
jgi:hypothetical protein